MSKTSLCGIAPSHPHAERIVAALKAADFANDAISVLQPDQACTRDLAPDQNPETHAVLIAGHTPAEPIGGPLGWIAGIGPIAHAGTSPFEASAPPTPGLIGLGLSADEARRYEDKIREGKILISVQTADANATARAREIFDHNGAEDICTTGPAATAPSTPPAEVPSSVHYSTES